MINLDPISKSQHKPRQTSQAIYNKPKQPTLKRTKTMPKFKKQPAANNKTLRKFKQHCKPSNLPRSNSPPNNNYPGSNNDRNNKCLLLRKSRRLLESPRSIKQTHKTTTLHSNKTRAATSPITRTLGSDTLNKQAIYRPLKICFYKEITRHLLPTLTTP